MIHLKVNWLELVNKNNAYTGYISVLAKLKTDQV
jgi:hypothetical protein